MAAEQVIFKNVGRSFNQTPQMPSLWSDSNGIGLWRWQFFLGNVEFFDEKCPL
jgi:hypothetical protein